MADSSSSSSSTVIVSGGQVSSGLVITVNQTLTVMSGGVVSNTQLDPSFAYANSDDNTYAAEEDVYGSSIGTQINDGDQEVFSGGVSINATVGSGGTLEADAGATVRGAQILNGGQANIGEDYSSGLAPTLASDITVHSGGAVYVDTNATVTNTIVSSGGYMEVDDAGSVASGVTVKSGAVFIADSGTVADSVTVESGGFFLAEPGASASNITGASAGYVILSDNDDIVEVGLTSNNVAFQSVTLSDFIKDGDTEPTRLLVTSGATIYSVTATTGNAYDQNSIENYGTLSTITFSGSATGGLGVTIHFGGKLLEGALSATVSGSGYQSTELNVYVSSGGFVENIDMHSGTGMTIESGALVKALSIQSGAIVQNSYLTSQSEIEIEGGTTRYNTFSDTTIWLRGGETTYDTFQSGELLNILDGSPGPVTVSHDTFNNASVAVMKSAASPTTTIDHNTFIGSSANVSLMTPGVVLSANTYISGAYLLMQDAGDTTSYDTFLSGATEIVESGTSASYQTFSASELDIRGGSVSNITLNDSQLGMNDGAVLNNVTLTGNSVLELANATLNNVSIEKGTILIPHYGTDGLTIQGNKLIYTVPGTDTVNTITLTGAGSDFKLDMYGDEDDGEYIIDDGTPCYCRGTLIETDAGDVPVETLKIGDKVRTLRNGYRPVKWIGRRAYSGQFAAGNRDVLPVVFKTGSLGRSATGQALPWQDLAVSPLHAMYLDGVLVPAVLLVNNDSIVQAEAMDEVAYFHIELESHDILIANGVESESFIDDDSRGMFHNAAEYSALYPDTRQSPARYCAPRVEQGHMLEAIRHRLNYGTVAPKPVERLNGFVDTVTRHTVCGWARTPGNAAPVSLQVLNNGVVLGHVVANLPRPDVGSACGFVFEIPGGLNPAIRHVLEVRRMEDAAPVGNSPWVLDMPEHQPLQAIIARTPTTPLNGFIDTVSHDRIAGWAHNPAHPHEPVALQILANGQIISTLVANALRPDVRQAGACPTARCGFDVLLPGSLSPFTKHVIEIRREQDGALLGAPRVLETATVFDQTVEKALADAVAATAGKPHQDDVLHFLLAQVDRLKAAKAEEQSGKAAHALARTQQRQGRDVVLHNRNKRVLVIDTRQPDARRDAGSCALLSHMRAFAALGYDVSFAAADHMAGAAVLPDMPQAQVLAAPFYSSIEDILRQQRDSFDVVYLHRVDTAARYATLARQLQKRSRILYSVADLHCVRLARQAQAQSRPELLAHAKQVRQAEYAAMTQADCVITHSADEAALIAENLPQKRVQVVPWAYTTRSRAPAFTKRQGVVFVGNYAHAPNRDAALWLVKNIMPRVWQHAPHIECSLAGADMPDSIHALAGNQVRVLGHVPDLQSLFDASRLSIAPLRFGAGIKGKVLDSLAAGLPCVMTPVAAEGLDLPDTFTRLIAHDADALAALIIAAHEDSALYQHTSKAGRAYMRDHWSEQQVENSLTIALAPRAVQIRQAG